MKRFQFFAVLLTALFGMSRLQALPDNFMAKLAALIWI